MNELISKNILICSLLVSIFTVILFFSFCIKSNVFKYFGRSALSNKNLKILFLGSLLPMITTLFSLYIGDVILNIFNWNLYKIDNNVQLFEPANIMSIIDALLIIINYFLFKNFSFSFKKELLKTSLNDMCGNIGNDFVVIKNNK